MQYTKLGSTGVRVSRICLGCMSYGDPKWRGWVLDESAAQPFFRRAVESGINFFEAQLPQGRQQVRTTHLGFEPPQISPGVAEFLRLDASLSEQQLNQSVMLIVSEPLPANHRTPA